MKNLLGYGFAVLIAAGAITFEMSESLVFWELAFTDENWFMAYLGFFLTSIAMLGYFYDFLYKAKGKTQKTTAIVMSILCGIGSLATAGYGFKINAFDKYNFEFTKSDLTLMSILVVVLVALHILALFIYYGGDAIAAAWKDDDKDGIPNFLDNTDNRHVNQQPMTQYNSDLAALRAELAALKAEKENPTPAAKP